jgi:transcription termination factor NusB
MMETISIKNFTRVWLLMETLKEDMKEEVSCSIKASEKESHQGNHTALFGGILFSYCISKAKLVDALKIHKKIQEYDLHMLEEAMPDDNENIEWCRINGEDMKAGEYYRQVCEMVKEQYDRRDTLIKDIIECMKMDDFKILLDKFNEESPKMPEGLFNEAYKDFMKCPFDMVLTFKESPFE